MENVISILELNRPWKSIRNAPGKYFGSIFPTVFDIRLDNMTIDIVQWIKGYMYIVLHGRFCSIQFSVFTNLCWMITYYELLSSILIYEYDSFSRCRSIQVKWIHVPKLCIVRLMTQLPGQEDICLYIYMVMDIPAESFFVHEFL